MMNEESQGPRFNLDDLAEAAVLEGGKRLETRTIRSWIKAGVLPGPDGKGRGQGRHYGERHRIRLLFLQRIQKALGENSRLPLRLIATYLPNIDEGTIRRVARGDVPHAELQSAIATHTLHAHRSAEAIAPMMSAEEPPSPVPKKTRRDQGDEHWTTIEVTKNVSLRMRGDDPDQVAQLAKMARHLREWTEGEP
jgi:DNA-binding transcriptional MerR regulator